MTEIIDILIVLSSKFGYLGIIFLMTIESSFIPFPSEVIIPPAAYLAAQGRLDIYLVVLSGVVGSLLGAIINYLLAMTLGRSVVYGLARRRIANIILINEAKIKKAETYFLKHGNLSTFIGRLVVGIRQLISIPAGFARMNFKNFILYTTLGSGLWIIFLAIFGYTLGANIGLIEKYYGYYKEISLILILVVVLVGGGIYWRKRKRHRS